MTRIGQRFPLILFLVSIMFIPISCRTWSTGEERAAQAYNDANSLREAGMPEKALELYLLALEFQPDMAAASYNMALVMVELNRSEEALEILQQLNNRDPRNLTVLRAMGWAAWEAGKPESSLSYYLSALVVFPGDIKSLRGASEIYEATERPGIAVEMRRFLVSLENTIESRLNLAETLEMSGRYQEALETYQDILALEPLNPAALDGASENSEIAGLYRESINYRLAQIAVDPNKGELWWHVARIRLVEIGDYEKGLEALEASIDAGFDDSEALEQILADSPPVIRPAVRTLLTESAEN